MVILIISNQKNWKKNLKKIIIKKFYFLFFYFIFFFNFFCFVNVKTDPRLARVLFCHQMSVGTCGQAEAQPQTS
jgi:hypothetical protein